MNENEHFWVTNLAFEGGGPPEAWAGGPTPPGLYIYVLWGPFFYNGPQNDQKSIT